MHLLKGKGQIIALLIICQGVFVVGGHHIYEMHESNSPHPQMKAGKGNSKQSGHVSYVDTNKDHHVTDTAYLAEKNYSPKHDDGSYLRTVPPLNTSLRKYYQIDIIINVKHGHIYQQFAMTPTKGTVPVNIQKRLDRSSLLRAVRHYNVQATREKTTHHKHGYLVTFNRLNYDSIYNQKNERYHFIHIKPFVIPPINHHHTDKGSVTFTKHGLISQNLSFNRISNKQAKKILTESKTNLNPVGY